MEISGDLNPEAKSIILVYKDGKIEAIDTKMYKHTIDVIDDLKEVIGLKIDLKQIELPLNALEKLEEEEFKHAKIKFMDTLKEFMVDIFKNRKKGLKVEGIKIRNINDIL